MKILVITFLLTLAAHTSFSQHGHNDTKPALSFASVLSQQLTDAELKEYKMESLVMSIIPGGEDTVSHRHDCEIFGYVLEGSVFIGLEHKEPKMFKAGEMFFEKRNILHSITRNASKEQPAKVLLFFIIKNGRPGYTRAYPEK